jgi:hypothetical protein
LVVGKAIAKGAPVVDVDASAEEYVSGSRRVAVERFGGENES